MFSTVIERLYDRRDAAGESGEDAGFTLIELMVVLLILAILLAIAIPTFLGVTKSANDRAAQSNLNTALTNAKALYQSQGQSYTSTAITASSLFATSLGAAEPSLAMGTGSSTSQATISVNISTVDGNGLILAAYSKNSNNCWLVYDTPATVTTTPANAPWGTSATGTNGGAAVTGTGQNVVISITQLGTSYAEIKGASTSTGTMESACTSSQPVVPTGATYGWSTTAFPAL
jgi:type IV pilus assembly protein PilA